MTTDLPPATALPLPVVLAVGAGVVLATAGTLSARAATRPDLPATRWHRDLPAGITATLDRPSSRYAARLLALIAVAGALLAAALSDRPVDATAALAWLTAVGLVAGPLLRALNPVRLAAAWTGRTATVAAPGASAVVSLAAVSLVLLTVDDGRVLAAVALVHLGVQAALCRRRGAAWAARGDGVEALATLVGHAAPLGRRGGGRLAWRNPVVNAAHVTLPAAALWLTAVVVGVAVARPVAPVLVVPVFVAATTAAGALLRLGFIRPWFHGAAAPLAAAYGLVAGGRWLGPLDLVVFTLLHAAAVAVLHRQAIARHDPRTARAVQFPPRCVVVVSVLVGLMVLASA